MKESENRVSFVGAGPGDPELITVRGMRLIAEADVIVYAGSLVPEAILVWKKPEAEAINSAGMFLEEIIVAIETAYIAGKRVVRLHTGDPSLYGAVAEQMAELRKRGIPYRMIPGVTAAFAAAAAIGIEYTIPEVSQTLILTRMAGRTPVPEAESLESLAAHRASMAIYLSAALIDRVAEILEKAYGKESPCAVACQVSQPEERILRIRVGELAGLVKREGIDRQALIIVGRALESSMSEEFVPSKLYDKNFTHGFRKSADDTGKAG